MRATNCGSPWYLSPARCCFRQDSRTPLTSGAATYDQSWVRRKVRLELAAMHSAGLPIAVRPRSELAVRYGAGVEEETTAFPHAVYGEWRHEHPLHWDELPWAD